MLRRLCKLFGGTAGKALAACAASVALVVAFGLPAGATQAFPTTDDHATEIATGWWWYYGVTAAQVNGFVNANHARLTQVRVINPDSGPAGPTFAVTMVANSGAYGSGWWWYYGQTPSQVSALLTQHHARLISLEPYQVNGNLLFAVVMVPNTGVQDRAWWWYYGQTVSSIAGWLTTNNARLTELRPYVVGNQVVYAVIMISNTGTDNTVSDWWINVPISTIQNSVNQGMRVIAFSPDPGGGFDAILVASEGETWYWYYGATPASVGQHVTAHQTRLIDISPYTSSNGQLVFTEVELGDNNPAQAPVNARSAQVANFANTHGWGGGYNGAYFISSTPGAKPIIAVNSNFRYEPASSIKVLYLLYTLRKGVSMSAPFTYYWNQPGAPNPNACPSLANVPETAANKRTTTVGTALTDMIQQSNNVYTRGFAIRWGLGPVEAMAKSLGMASTHLAQPFIGCGFLGGVRNELTLADAARLYAAVSNGKAGLTGAERTAFFKILVGGTPVAADPFGSVVKQQAALLKKSSIVGKFLAAMNVRWKAGSYEFCLSSSCAPNKLDLALTGWMSIPFKSKGKTVEHSYEFGDFVNDFVESCNSCTAQTNAYSMLEAVGAQAALTTIRAALATWP